MTSQNMTMDQSSNQPLAILSQMENLTLNADTSSTSSSTPSSQSKRGCLSISPDATNRASPNHDFAKLMHRLDLMLAMMERFTAAYRHNNNNNNNNNTSKASLSRERFGLQQQEQQQQQAVEVFITIGALDGVFVEVGKGFFIVREQSRVLFSREFMTVRLGTEAEYRDGFADMLYASGASSVGFLERLRGNFWA